MMIAILSDAHANAHFLASCLQKIRRYKIDRLFFLGDLVGYFDQPQETFELLMHAGAECLMGNHEAMMLGILHYDSMHEEIYQLQRTLTQLTENTLKTISEWLPYRYLEIDKLKILLIHGSPYQPLTEYAYQNCPASKFSTKQIDFVFCGHTHIPYVQKNSYTTVINVGSCGLPRDRGNCPSFVVFDTKKACAKIVRFEESLSFLKDYAVHDKVIDCLKRTKSEQ